ncbi:MAG TPA: mechanosensitive ion channel family protein, partial [Microthrixaceae bacterium]|nr:mechanosensitive ion channel family protein [Microthrixaceae bacterium]
ILALAYLANRLLRSMIARTGRRMAENADRLGGYMPDGLRTREVDGRAVARAATMSTITRSMATAVVDVVAAAWILAVLGVSLAAIVASAGVLGVALGFGAQNLVRDVLAGWFILVEDRYGVGDTIDAGAPAVGTVERVTLRSTRLRDINGTVWHVANGEILRVGNKSQSWSRAVVDVAVTPDADLERAREILGEVGERMLLDEAWSGLVTSSPNVLGVQRIDPLGITLRVVIDTAPGEQFPVEREYRLRVLQAFDAAGISLSAPYAGGPAAAAWPGGPGGPGRPGGPGGPGGTGTGDTGTGEAGPSSST